MTLAVNIYCIVHNVFFDVLRREHRKCGYNFFLKF